ncbi:hypothetical protein N9315_02690 [Alphaproteobacteria bacterium]|nr:hypothetical protein [Alphaproteobacteria bacterium]
MKNILSSITVLFIFVTSSIAFADSIGGSMHCTIKDEVIKKMDNGNGTSFGGSADDLSVGDKFPLSYLIDNSGTFHIKTPTPKSDSSFNHSFEINLLSEDTYLFANAEPNFTSAVYRPLKSLPFVYLSMEVRQNQFKIGRVNDNTLSMRRYYKSDWMGIYTSNSATVDRSLKAHTYSFSCSHSSNDKWAEVFDKIMSTALSRPHSPM